MEKIPNEIQELFDKYAFHLHELIERTNNFEGQTSSLKISSKWWGEFLQQYNICYRGSELYNQFDLHPHVTTVLGEVFYWEKEDTYYIIKRK